MMRKVAQRLRPYVLFNAPAGAETLCLEEQRALMRTLYWALLPLILLATYYFGIRLYVATAAAFVGVAGVQAIFAAVRKREATGGALFYAMLFALFAPPAAPAWMIVLSSAAGTLFASEIFGGTGRHLVHPVALGKAFLVYGFPQVTTLPYLGSMLDAPTKNGWIVVSLVLLIILVVLVAKKPSRLWILGGLFVAGFLTALLIKTKSYLPAGSQTKIFNADSLLFNLPLLPLEIKKVTSSMLAMWHWGGLLFAMAFLALDPALIPRGRVAMLLYGALIGWAAVFMRTLTTHGGAIPSALLLGALMAPLFIHGVSALRRNKGA